MWIVQYISISVYWNLCHYFLFRLQELQVQLMEEANERIQSFPLKRVFPLIISAMIQPTDQMSTRIDTKEKNISENQSWIHTTKSVLSLAQCSRNEEGGIYMPEQCSYSPPSTESIVLFALRNTWVIQSYKGCKLARVAFWATVHSVDAVYKMEKRYLLKKHKSWESQFPCSDRSVIESPHYQAAVRPICVNC